MALIMAVAVMCAQAKRPDGANVGSLRSGRTEQGEGQTPIEWIVLDRQEDRALLLSKYALDAMPFHEVEDWNVTWGDCTLRSWLNGEFLGVAFGDEERMQIIHRQNEYHRKCAGYAGQRFSAEP